jgi:peptidylprolyl isomerase
MVRFLTLASLLWLLGCGDSTSGDPTKVTYAPGLGVNLDAMERRESGLYVQDLQVGTGDTATAGRRVTVHYTGWLPNGRQFDSSRDRTPFSFTPGQNRVIAGWEEGIPGMKVGGVRKLVIPSDLGYGEKGSDPIPPDSVLIFDVELLSIP